MVLSRRFVDVVCLIFALLKTINCQITSAPGLSVFCTAEYLTIVFFSCILCHRIAWHYGSSSRCSFCTFHCTSTSSLQCQSKLGTLQNKISKWDKRTRTKQNRIELSVVYTYARVRGCPLYIELTKTRRRSHYTQGWTVPCVGCGPKG